MKYLLIILIVLSSCTTAKRCAKKFQAPTDSNTTYIETVKLDTIIQYIPGDTTLIMMPFDCPDSDTVIVDNSKQTIKYVVKDRIITVQAVCKDDSLQVVIANLRTDLKQTKNTVVTVKETPRFWKITGWIGIILTFLILAYIGFKIRF